MAASVPSNPTERRSSVASKRGSIAPPETEMATKPTPSQTPNATSSISCTAPLLLASAGSPFAALCQWVDLFVDFLVTKHGLANALRAQITIENGRVVQGNFDDYAPLRMEETPTVEAYAVPSAEAPTGIGEPPVPPVAPALCNAIYAATKKRIRALPILS